MNLHIFEENLNIEAYLNILFEMVTEMRQINNNNNKIMSYKIMSRSINHSMH